MPTFPFARPNPIDVPAEYRRLRADEPVARVSTAWSDDVWLVSRYADVRVVLSDPRFKPILPGFVGANDNDTSSLMQEPPAHTRLRGLVAKAFTARRVESLRPNTTRIAHDLIDGLWATPPPVDLMANFALALSFTVICELLGVPPADRTEFRDWSNGFLGLAPAPDGRAAEAGLRLHEQATRLVAMARSRESNDLLTALVAVRNENADRLTEAELVTMVITLIIAGYVVTADTIGLGIVALAEHGELDVLAGPPDAVSRAVEEVLRHQSFGGAARLAKEDVELGGVVIPAGAAVLASVASANRDEDRFPAPARFDPRRAGSSHLAFGYGIHHCLGAALARMELEVAFGALGARLPGLRLAVPAAELTWRSNLFGTVFGDQGPRELPVDWDRRRR